MKIFGSPHTDYRRNIGLHHSRVQQDAPKREQRYINKHTVDKMPLLPKAILNAATVMSIVTPAHAGKNNYQTISSQLNHKEPHIPQRLNLQTLLNTTIHAATIFGSIYTKSTINHLPNTALILANTPATRLPICEPGAVIVKAQRHTSNKNHAATKLNNGGFTNKHDQINHPMIVKPNYALTAKQHDSWPIDVWRSPVEKNKVSTGLGMLILGGAAAGIPILSHLSFKKKREESLAELRDFLNDAYAFEETFLRREPLHDPYGPEGYPNILRMLLRDIKHDKYLEPAEIQEARQAMARIDRLLQKQAHGA